MAVEWEVIAADPTTGILLFDQRLPADNKTQAIAQSGVGNFVQSNAAQIRARGIDPGNVQIIARFAPSGLASEVVPYLYGTQSQAGMQLSVQQQATLTQESQLTNPGAAAASPANLAPTQPVSPVTGSSGVSGGFLGGLSSTTILIAAAGVAALLALTGR